jgi:hypothetical protein
MNRNTPASTPTILGSPNDLWPAPVRQRIDDLNQNGHVLQDRADLVSQKLSADTRKRLLNRAVEAKTAVQRIFWLRREADLVSTAAMPLSACKDQCSHCCNIGVMITEQEAGVIGKEIGRKPESPAVGNFIQGDEGVDPEVFWNATSQMTDEFTGVPCTFLGSDKRCTIYEFRPMACRHQINLDFDGLLCEIVPGSNIPVPYLNMSNSKFAYLFAMGLRSKISDIRHFFKP